MQASVLEAIPKHGSPPNFGEGLEQVLLETKVPPPQLSEQDSAPIQGDHDPWAVGGKRIPIMRSHLVVHLLGTAGLRSGFSSPGWSDGGPLYDKNGRDFFERKKAKKEQRG